MDGIDAVGHPKEIPEHQHTVRRKEIKEGDSHLATARQLGHNVHFGHLGTRKLVFHFKGADAVYLVTKEIDAEGVFG